MNVDVFGQSLYVLRHWVVQSLIHFISTNRWMISSQEYFHTRLHAYLNSFTREKFSWIVCSARCKLRNKNDTTAKIEWNFWKCVFNFLVLYVKFAAKYTMLPKYDIRNICKKSRFMAMYTMVSTPKKRNIMEYVIQKASSLNNWKRTASQAHSLVHARNFFTHSQWFHIVRVLSWKKKISSFCF